MDISVTISILLLHSYSYSYIVPFDMIYKLTLYILYTKGCNIAHDKAKHKMFFLVQKYILYNNKSVHNIFFF